MLGKIFKAVVDTATTPIAVVRDVFTLGGELEGENKSYTRKKIEQITEDLDDII